MKAQWIQDANLSPRAKRILIDELHIYQTDGLADLTIAEFLTASGAGIKTLTEIATFMRNRLNDFI